MILVTKPVRLLEDITINYGKLRFLIPDIIIEELKNLTMRNSYKISHAAKTVLKVISQFEVVETKKSRYPDDVLLDYAISNNCAIATMDKNLIKRALSEEIMVFSLQNNKITRVINHNQQI